MMQDIDDFDPLDDILLSDDEPPKQIAPKSTTVFHKTEDIDFDDESRKNKKKKMLAELFGSNEESKAEVKPASVPASSVQNKSGWLDLKNDSPEKAVSADLSSTKKYGFENEPRVISTESSASTHDRISTKSVPDVGEKSVHFVDNHGNSGRRKSEASPALTRKTKPHFKSLDLNLDFDFDTTSADDFVPKSSSTSAGLSVSVDDVLGESSYKPSIGLNRRLGSSKTRTSFLENKPSSSVINPEIHQEVILDLNRDTLPSWLEPKEAILKAVAVKSHDVGSTSESLPAEKKDTKEEYNPVENKISSVGKADEPSNFVSVVSELVKKQEDLKQIAKNQVQVLSAQEQEIRNSALELMKQQRDSVKALIQILSVDDVMLHESGEESSKVSRAALEGALSQLQTKLVQFELERAEFEMQLKHTERKHKIDLTMMEDLCKYKLKIAEEREIHLENEITSLQEEFNTKLQKRKETEEELVRSYKEKLRILQEEHLTEMKRVAELQTLKSSMGLNHNERKNTEDVVSKELTMREIAIEEKQKELLEFEERLNRDKVALDSKKASINARIESFEIKIAKEKVTVEQQKKDLKLSQNIFSEKENYWEREKQRERDYLTTCKQELEIFKENLLMEERKLMKERFEISAEKAGLDAIINAEGSTGQIADVIQARAELRGTIEEVRRLKSRLESERNEIKKEEMRLKEEKWRLRSVEQELSLQHKHFQKLLQEAELKREEGVGALKKAQLIESQMNERVENVEKRIMELNRREELLTKEKIEISKERDLLNKKKYQLDMILPQLSYDEQLPYKILNKPAKSKIPFHSRVNSCDFIFGVSRVLFGAELNFLFSVSAPVRWSIFFSCYSFVDVNYGDALIAAATTPLARAITSCIANFGGAGFEAAPISRPPVYSRALAICSLLRPSSGAARPPFCSSPWVAESSFWRPNSVSEARVRLVAAKTTPIQQDGILDTQPPYGRRGGGTICGGGKPAALANSFGLQFFAEDNGGGGGGGNAAGELEQGEIPTPARLRPGLTGSAAAVALSSGGAPGNRLHSSGPCCALPFPVTQAHNIGRSPGVPNNMITTCAGCEKPILDKYLLNVLEKTWHASCVRCFDCGSTLNEKCFSRDGRLFCRSDFFRRYGTKCGGCSQGISPQDLVRKARDKVFHLNCFTCMICNKKLSTGEELYILDDNKFICKDDFMNNKNSQDSLTFSGSEDEDDEESNSSASGLIKHHLHSQLHPGTPETNNNSLSAGDLQGSLSHNLIEPKIENDSEDQGSLDGDAETRDSQIENKSPEDANSGSKRRGPRTTIKAKQLEVLKNAFAQTPKPTRHIREQLAKETGLPMRVIQVWFQNKRSKERRLKQMTSMNRAYYPARKMRGFPINFSPGLEDPHSGDPFLPYGKFDFPYGNHGPFHPEFFSGHHGPPGTLPFNHSGGPMDGPVGPLSGEFGGMGPEPTPNFMGQQPPPPAHSEAPLISQRSSPDFISSQGGGSASSGGFSDGPPLQSEQLVW